MQIGKMFPSEYLRGIDIANPTIVTIASVEEEQAMSRETNKLEPEFVMTFKETPKKLRLNITMAKECALITNDKQGDSDNWINKKVTVYRTEIKAFGKTHIVPRLRKTKAGDKKFAAGKQDTPVKANGTKPTNEQKQELPESADALDEIAQSLDTEKAPQANQTPATDPKLTQKAPLWPTEGLAKQFTDEIRAKTDYYENGGTYRLSKAIGGYGNLNDKDNFDAKKSAAIDHAKEKQAASQAEETADHFASLVEPELLPQEAQQTAYNTDT